MQGRHHKDPRGFAHTEGLCKVPGSSTGGLCKAPKSFTREFATGLCEASMGFAMGTSLWGLHHELHEVSRDFSMDFAMGLHKASRASPQDFMKSLAASLWGFAKPLETLLWGFIMGFVMELHKTSRGFPMGALVQSFVTL